MLFSTVLLLWNFIWLSPVPATEDAHPFHVSITLLEGDLEEKRIKCAHKIFIDDLEKHLKALNLIDFSIEKAHLNEKLKEAIETYLNSNVVVNLNDEKAIANWVGMELEEDIFWIYRSYPFKRKLKSLEVNNSILMDFYDDQLNIVHLDYNNKKSSAYFNQGSDEAKTLIAND